MYNLFIYTRIARKSTHRIVYTLHRNIIFIYWHTYICTYVCNSASYFDSFHFSSTPTSTSARLIACHFHYLCRFVATFACCVAAATATTANDDDFLRECLRCELLEKVSIYLLICIYMNMPGILPVPPPHNRTKRKIIYLQTTIWICYVTFDVLKKQASKQDKHIRRLTSK